MDFCLRCLWSNENFRDVIFTDESTVKMDTSLNYSFQKKTAHARYVGKPKHPYSISLMNNLNNKFKYIDYE